MLPATLSGPNTSTNSSSLEEQQTQAAAHKEQQRHDEHADSANNEISDRVKKDIHSELKEDMTSFSQLHGSSFISKELATSEPSEPASLMEPIYVDSSTDDELENSNRSGTNNKAQPLDCPEDSSVPPYEEDFSEDLLDSPFQDFSSLISPELLLESTTPTDLFLKSISYATTSPEFSLLQQQAAGPESSTSDLLQIIENKSLDVSDLRDSSEFCSLPLSSDFDDFSTDDDEQFTSASLISPKALPNGLVAVTPKPPQTLFPEGFYKGVFQGKRAILAKGGLKRHNSKSTPSSKRLCLSSVLSKAEMEDEFSKQPEAVDSETPEALDDEEYDVEMILAKRQTPNKRIEYLVKWRNYPEEENTWESVSNLKACQEIVAAFNLCIRFSSTVTSKPTSSKIFFPESSSRARMTLLTENIHDFMKILSQDKGPIITVVNEVDSEGPPANFEYITRNVYMEGVPEPSRLRVKGICKCKALCSINKTCGCIQRNGGLAPYSDTGLIRVSEGTPVYECTPYCCCPPTCKGKVVQQGRKVEIQVFKTLNKGWGVRAMQSIPKGTFITEYLGEVITEKEADARGQNCDREGLNYLFDLDGQLEESLYTIDGQSKGNVSHFFNHSCDANLVVHPVFIDDHDPGLHRLAFFANRNISRLEELCINYFGTKDLLPSADVPEDPGHEKNYSVCYCGAPNCAGKFFK